MRVLAWQTPVLPWRVGNLLRCGSGAQRDGEAAVASWQDGSPRGVTRRLSGAAEVVRRYRELAALDAVLRDFAAGPPGWGRAGPRRVDSAHLLVTAGAVLVLVGGRIHKGRPIRGV